MKGTLTGKVAIVTGAGQGLGFAIARELGLAGSKVALLEIDPSSCDQAATALRNLGIHTQGYPTDVTRSQEVDQAFSSIYKAMGRLDIVVNNAGISRIGPHTHDVSDEDWLHSVAVMQTGVFYCMRAAGRLMIDQGSGSVVNISSIRGFSPMPGRITYSGPKAAVIMMSSIAAGEWAQYGLRVNTIAPGFLKTRMHDDDVARGIFDETKYLDTIPSHRFGDPSEVGKLVVYLSSDDAAYITGACITIDGGLTSIASG